MPCYQSWLEIWVSHPIKFSPSLLKIILSCNRRGQEENNTQGTGWYSDKMLPRACQTNSSPAEQWSSGFHHKQLMWLHYLFSKLLPVFQVLPPHKQLPRATWSHFLRVSRSIQPHVCSFPKSSQQSITTIQCLLSDCHLSSLKFSFLLLQVLSLSPCLLSPPHCASNFRALFQLPFPPCHILLILMLPLLILGIFPFALLLLLLILR